MYRPRLRYSPIALSGAVVVVSGGGRGIGAATAAAFASEGASVWIGDVDADSAEATAATIPGCGSGYLDVTDAASWQSFIADGIGAAGRVDVLVNNAGVMPLGSFVEERAEITDLVLDVNIRGLINGMRAVLPGMVERGRGHIVNIASMAGMIPAPGMVTYNASKFAALGLSLAARRELGPANVSVSAVLPAPVRTELASGVSIGALPMVEPHQVADAVVKTVRTRRARTSVPGWSAPAWALTDVLVPPVVQTVIRALLDDRRALTAIDPAQRQAYRQRLQRHGSTHAAAQGRR